MYVLIFWLVALITRCSKGRIPDMDCWKGAWDALDRRFLGGSGRLLGGFGRFWEAPGGSGNGVRRFLGRCWAGLSKFWEDLENLSSGDVEMFKDDIWLLF
jgi:hypothetical protein